MSHLGTLRRSHGVSLALSTLLSPLVFSLKGQDCNSLEGTICFRCSKLRGTYSSPHLIVLYACIFLGGAKKDVISATFYNTSRSPKFNYEILIIWFCCIGMEVQGKATFGWQWCWIICIFGWNFCNTRCNGWHILISWYKFWLILTSFEIWLGWNLKSCWAQFCLGFDS
jgi:hypothetical protein